MKFVIAFLCLIVVVSVFGATDEEQWAEFKVNEIVSSVFKNQNDETFS